MAVKSYIASGWKPVKGSVSPSLVKRVKKDETQEEKNSYNENQSTFNPSPVEKALQNTVVLQNIFKFLPYNDLLTCHSVDLPLWSTETEHAIYQHPILSIIARNKEITMAKTIQEKKIQYKFQTSLELLFDLEKSERGHEIWLTLSLSSEYLEMFLTKFANAICHLHLVNSGGKISLSDLQGMLGKLPNLADLTFDMFPHEWQRRNERWNVSILLPQVRTVVLGHRPFPSSNFYRRFLEDLLKIMPNLRAVHGYPLDCLDILNLDNNLNLGIIKTVDVSSSSILNIRRELSHLARVSPRLGLQMLHLRLRNLSQSSSKSFWESSCRSLSSVLWNNQNTLEYLIVEPFLCPHVLVYPEMKAVKKLRFSSWGNHNNMFRKAKAVKFFGADFDPRKTFPELTEVTLHSTHCTLPEFLELFPVDVFFSRYFKGVTALNLKFHVFEDFYALETISRIFPDVTSLSIYISIRWLDKVLPHILWMWPKLISLKLKVGLTGVLEYNSNYNQYYLDSVFTGISSVKCKDLRSHKEKLTIDMKIYQENLAISSMKELKELTLIFHSKVFITSKLALFSHVTPFYGFQCLPDLKVTCAIPWDDEENDKIQEMLSPIKEYVIFRPNYYEPDAYDYKSY